ncbi:FumA C-terminus/TtdB family hydratase beta subunit [Bryobacter aggregatus]|uniref:FumA C-terminus/TtdB family hydratase beta subunit n=1 Tax=Bryobacter aggregatus TaxID=360054 RepID=UPI0004E12CCB|nr:FumA C-terminus/TtdB family hydratase beta subunit [Bryobacter aggregatus]
MEFLAASLLELITQTSVNLPPDVRAAMGTSMASETPNTQSSQALSIIATNIDMAVEDQGPICQDTGMPTFLIHTPVGVNQIELKKAVKLAVAEATKRGKLRPNSVDSITGQNSGDNLGHETPVFHFEQWEKDDIEVKLLLKGGGCENKNIQYSLPATLENIGKAGRDLEGVRKCILHAVWQAQGQGCAPGALGVCIGSDRAHGYWLAKEQLFRTLDDTNPDPVLAKLEAEIMEEANKISVGAMGFGGKASLIGCKIVAANRLPASFFVSVAYDCWAFRRLGVLLDAKSGAIKQWLYRDPERPIEKMSQESGFPLSGREVVLTAPITEAQVRELKVGDVVLIRGRVYTGRDAVHAHLMKTPPPMDLNGQIIYHCGPVMLKTGETWQVKAAGPTTSSREEPYQATIIEKYGVRAVIGKGGMGAKTSAALQQFGAVYLNGIGGAAQFYARTVQQVAGVDLMEFGIPEAMWHLDVHDFAAIVTMDSHGNSLHREVEEATGQELAALATV